MRSRHNPNGSAPDLWQLGQAKANKGAKHRGLPILAASAYERGARYKVAVLIVLKGTGQSPQLPRKQRPAKMRRAPRPN
jgi:hypothetical protein